MIVELTTEDIEVCQIFGKLRSESCRSNNVKNVRVGNQGDIDSDIIGFIGEYGFAKRFNVFPDFILNPRSGSPDGIIKGYRYDVKSTTYKNGKLLSTLKINPDIDIYVLAIVDKPIVYFKGYALKNDLIQEQNIQSLGYGPSYCLEQSELRPLTDFT